MIGKGYQFIGRLSLDTVRPLLGAYKVDLIVESTSYVVYLGGHRKALLWEKDTCDLCGAKGTHFRLYHCPHVTVAKFRNVVDLFTATGLLLTADHIIPKALGGPTHPLNLRVLCEPCNSAKADSLPGQELLNSTITRLHNVGIRVDNIIRNINNLDPKRLIKLDLPVSMSIARKSLYDALEQKARELCSTSDRAVIERCMKDLVPILSQLEQIL